MDSISNDDNLRDIVESQRLVDATSDDKQFHFSTHDVNHVMDCLNKGFVKSVNMCDGGSDIILDTYIRYYNGFLFLSGVIINYILHNYLKNYSFSCNASLTLSITVLSTEMFGV